MDRRYMVPEGMLKAIQKAWFEYVADDEDHQRMILEAALRWLSENPQFPTPEQVLRLVCEAAPEQQGLSCQRSLPKLLVGWQRIMFLAPEPDVPEEVKDLLRVAHFEDGDSINTDIIEAYRRGLRKR